MGARRGISRCFTVGTTGGRFGTPGAGTAAGRGAGDAGDDGSPCRCFAGPSGPGEDPAAVGRNFWKRAAPRYDGLCPVRDFGLQWGIPAAGVIDGDGRRLHPSG